MKAKLVNLRVDDPEFYTLGDLADMLKISLSSIRHMREHRLTPPAYKVGRHLRFARADVKDWLEGLRESDAA